ncbi:lipid A biosynthesis acyltransferase [Chlorobaculum sp. 24CR]|jgi:Kdo2-lipid IVA lauroyltransferase/acyltransferase|uniref:lysophospholipid acyltransferase family protein n=1 Tax=Chlorobaculum sp. 24CR TaxID=2508878 RepID=UPI00100B4903|nr:lysophospholipid acyltransferase family protein [Chlorobaculum sp. 24CR]RXK84959.1 lipid A biosynthesis acyltransferase [Chlorobaculum sp. 24CR]
MSFDGKRLKKIIRERSEKVSQSLTFEALNLFGLVVRKLNRQQARRLGAFVGDFLHRILGLRRALVYRNLSLTFPEKSPEEIRRIATAMYRNVASTFLEVMRLPLIRTREDAAALVDIEGDAAFRAWQRSGETGAVFISAHYGNWELMAMAFGLMIHPVTIIVKRLRNRVIDTKMNEYRTMRGNRIVYPAQSVREGLRLLQKGGTLAILGDQSDPDEANFDEFLGRRATILHGAAFFALRAKVPMFMPICTSNGDGRYTITVSTIDTSDLTFNKEDIATLAVRYTRAIEAEIRRRPEEWFWLHNRWKRG